MSESSRSGGVLHEIVVHHEVHDVTVNGNEAVDEGLDTVVFHSVVLAGQSVDEGDPGTEEDREDEKQLGLTSFGFESGFPCVDFGFEAHLEFNF